MYRFLLLFITSLFLSGCFNATGPKFREVSPSQEKNSVVYLYRPDKLAASARSPDVHVDNKFICEIENGGYCRFELPEGRHIISIDTDIQLNNGAIALDINSASKLFIAYDIESELKWGLAVKGASMVGAFNGITTAAISWTGIGEGYRLILEMKEPHLAMHEIKETSCSNCNL